MAVLVVMAETGPMGSLQLASPQQPLHMSEGEILLVFRQKIEIGIGMLNRAFPPPKKMYPLVRRCQIILGTIVCTPTVWVGRSLHRWEVNIRLKVGGRGDLKHRKGFSGSWGSQERAKDEPCAAWERRTLNSQLACI